MNDQASATVEPFRISRELRAPRALVWRVSTEAKHMAQWFGAKGTKVIHAAMDLRVGGTYHYGLASPDGSEMWGRQVFREITPIERLVFVQSFSDPEGGLGRHPAAATWPREMLATTTFEELGPEKTLLTVSWVPLGATAEELATFDQARAGMSGGFGGTFDQLEGYLATFGAGCEGDAPRSSPPGGRGKLSLTASGESELVMTRAFAAPRPLVFAALTEPAHVRRWLLGPPGWTMPVCEIDFRVGGTFRYVWRNDRGTDMGMGGTYREIAAPERIVHSELFDEDWTGGEALVTTLLEERDGRTTMTTTVRYSSRAARDGVFASPMEAGVAQSYDRLEEVLVDLQGQPDAHALGA